MRLSTLLSLVIMTMLTMLNSCSTPPCPDENCGYLQGVASFDPTQESVLLWTRYSPDDPSEPPHSIKVEVATDEAFANIVSTDQLELQASNNHVATFDIQGLSPYTSYYYRFDYGGHQSPIGHTKTLPQEGTTDEVSLAVASCANYQAGLFNVYGAIAQSDVDVVIHLGDYIYEYGAGQYGTNALTDSLGRAHKPPHEILTLDDYRTRYNQYRSDPQLQEAHRLKPFICVYDDHEISNDSYKTGAQNHQADKEGPFEKRKAVALQAWQEYLPSRVKEKDRIYRSFQFGDIAELYMLDTRLIGRDPQINYGDYFNQQGEFDKESFGQQWMNPNRSLLGATQRDWLVQSVKSSAAKWQVLGSQVLMGRYQLPANLLSMIAQMQTGHAESEVYDNFQSEMKSLTEAKLKYLKYPKSLSKEEQIAIHTTLPYNQDAWDGYPTEREAILTALNGKSIISIAGDTHNAWYSDLTLADGTRIGAEFGSTSVSSPGMEALFTEPETLQQLQYAVTTLMDELHYFDASQRGYLSLSLTKNSAEAEWIYVNTILSPSYKATKGMAVTIY